MGKSADASNFVEVGARLVPYATASVGTLRDSATILESWDKTDMRKKVAEKRENIQALSAEAEHSVRQTNSWLSTT